MSTFFERMNIARKDIEKYLSEFHFKADYSKETKKTIINWVTNYLVAHDLKGWKINLKDGDKGFSVILKADCELAFYVKGK